MAAWVENTPKTSLVICEKRGKVISKKKNVLLFLTEIGMLFRTIGSVSMNPKDDFCQHSCTGVFLIVETTEPIVKPRCQVETLDFGHRNVRVNQIDKCAL